MIAVEDMVIVEHNNPYHDWIIRQAKEKYKMPVESIEVTSEKVLRKLSYFGLLEVPTIYVLNFTSVPSPDMISQMCKIKLTKRIIFISVGKIQFSKSFDYVKNTYNKSVPYTLPVYGEWKDKEKFIVTNVIPKGVTIPSSDMYSALIRVAILNPSLWQSIFNLQKMFPEGAQISDKMLFSIFRDVEFVNMGEWIGKVIQGTTKNSVFKHLNYFLHVKNYSPTWLYKQLIEKIDILLIVYEGYNKGVVSSYTEKDIDNRAEVVKWDNVTAYKELSRKDKYWAYNQIKNIPYSQVVMARNIIYKNSCMVAEGVTEELLYQVILEIFITQSKYGKEKVFSRKSFR